MYMCVYVLGFSSNAEKFRDQFQRVFLAAKCGYSIQTTMLKNKSLGPKTGKAIVTFYQSFIIFWQ